MSTSCTRRARRTRRSRGGPRTRRAIWVETVVPYLVLDRSYAEKPDFEGAKYVMSPPLRELRHQPALWNALRTGLINTVATDHAPFDFAEQKEMGRGDFTKIPNGIPSVEDRVHLLYTHGVATGRIDLHRFVDAASTSRREAVRPVPAKRNDPTRRRRRSGHLRSRPIAARSPAKTQQMNVDYSAFEGWPIAGRTDVDDRPRQGASARRQVHRRTEPRANAETRSDAWVRVRLPCGGFRNHRKMTREANHDGYTTTRTHFDEPGGDGR